MRGASIVVGAAGGVGARVVAALQASGESAVFALDQFPPQAPTPPGVEWRVVDATQSSEVDAVADELDSLDLRPDVLVNCQGLFRVVPFSEINDDEWSLLQRVNLTSVFFTCRAFGSRMVRAGRGSIVNVASGAGERGSPRTASHYAAAKGGVIAFSKSLARELTPSGVRVNVVSPGALDTEMYGSPADRAGSAKTMPLGRLGTPQEIADVVAFLSSDKASFIAGAVIRANGGSLI